MEATSKLRVALVQIYSHVRGNLMYDHLDGL